jgi:hypothetical protein
MKDLIMLRWSVSSSYIPETMWNIILSQTSYTRSDNTQNKRLSLPEESGHKTLKR